MVKKSLTLFLALLLCNFLSAQEPYNAQFTIGPLVKTNGFGLNAACLIKQGKSIDQGVSLQISSLKHSRELRVQNQTIISPKTYFYGKQFRSFQVNPSYQFMFKEGSSGRNAASLSYGIELGPALAFLRPVYLLMLDFDQNENLSPVVEAYNPAIHNNQEEILGDAGWEKGFKEMHIKTGIHVGAFFNMGWDQEYLRKRLRTGISLDYYFTDLGILYKNKNQVFSSIFITYQIGKNR